MYRIYVTETGHPPYGATGSGERTTEAISSDPQPLELALDSIRHLMEQYLTVNDKEAEAAILAKEPEISIMYEPG